MLWCAPDAAADVGYRGPVCVEVEDRAYEKSLDDRKISLVQSAVYLRQFIPDQPIAKSKGEGTTKQAKADK